MWGAWSHVGGRGEGVWSPPDKAPWPGTTQLCALDNMVALRALRGVGNARAGRDPWDISGEAIDLP
jgi:hypothetical protein